MSRNGHCQHPSKVAISVLTRSASGGCRFESGERNLYAYVDFPPDIFDADRKAYDGFLRLLGDNLNSPAARKLLDL